jgi:hypothetical protein
MRDAERHWLRSHSGGSTPRRGNDRNMGAIEHQTPLAALRPHDGTAGPRCLDDLWMAERKVKTEREAKASRPRPLLQGQVVTVD